MSEKTSNQQPTANTPDPKRSANSSKSSNSSRAAQFAATQAAADGIQGDVKKPNKTVDEKITANMADRK